MKTYKDLKKETKRIIRKFPRGYLFTTNVVKISLRLKMNPTATLIVSAPRIANAIRSSSLASFQKSRKIWVKK